MNTAAPPQDRANDELLTIDEVCQMLKLSKDVMYMHRKRGTGPRVHKAGRALRYWRSDVIAWLEGGEGAA